MTGYTPLRLKITDEEDLAVASALLQDAVLPAEDIGYVAADREFICIASRFVQERRDRGAAGGDRVRVALKVKGVTGVKAKGIDRGNPDEMLNLLQMGSIEGGILLLFSGDKAIKLEAATIDATLSDYGEPWPTLYTPGHETE